MATYSINSNDIIEIQVLGRLHGQRTRNTFHYRYAGTTQLDGPTTIDALLNEFDTEVWMPINSLLSNEWAYDGLLGQKIQSTRYRARFKGVAGIGGVIGNSLPSSVCVVMRRKAILSGRRFQGRIFVPGIPAQSESDSKLAPGVTAAWTAAASGLKEPLEGGTAVEPFVPTVSKAAGQAGLADVDLVELDTILRQQRRREIGVGE